MDPPKQDSAALVATGVPYSDAARNALPVGQWSSGLYSCTDDCSLCCLTLWCPCITFGRIADIIDRGSPSCRASGALYALIAFTGCQCLYSCSYRPKLRSMYNLPETPCGDFWVHYCCELCALCQEYKELQNHGFDMALGWKLNMEVKGGAAAAAAKQAPIMQAGMMR